MKEIKAYQCQFCKKISRTITGIKLHEKACKCNPEKNHCSNCVHGILKHEEPDEYGWRQVSPYCDYHETFIFQKNKSDNAYFIECDVNYGYDGRGCLEPRSCHAFKSKGKHGFDPIEEIFVETIGLF